MHLGLSFIIQMIKFLHVECLRSTLSLVYNTNMSRPRQSQQHINKSIKKPALGRHGTAHRASGRKRTSATDIQCSQIPVAPTAHNATSWDPNTDHKLSI